MAARSIMKGLQEVAAHTPPRNSFTEFSSSSDEQEDTSEAVLSRIKLVETKLLELVDDHQYARPDSPDHDASEEFDVPLGSLPIHNIHAYPCADTYKKLPSPPSLWPQGPLMLRPTPGASMKIRGIRYADSLEYQSFPGICAGCILPVNTGREAPGKSLVVDFESPRFVGTLLMRVAGASSVDATHKQTETSYFDGKKRQFQVVVKGRFRKEGIPMSECVTGQVFDHAAGKLPARFIVNAFIKFISTLAPQLEVELDGDRPRFLTPLVATAHTVQVKHHDSRALTCTSCSASDKEKLVNFSVYAGSESMEEEVEEPPSDAETSVMGTVDASDRAAGPDTSIPWRRAARKKTFNHVAAEKAVAPTFDTFKEYTFEFYQHLLLLSEPEDFKINMGAMQVGLTRPLNGQPIKIFAAQRSNDLLKSAIWSFDIWHQSLYKYAKKKNET